MKQTLKAEHHASKLGKATRNPDQWFTLLETVVACLQIDYGEVIDDDELLDHILANLPCEYESIVQRLEAELNSGNVVDIEDVKHKKICKNKNIKEDQDEAEEEQALVAKGG